MTNLSKGKFRVCAKRCNECLFSQNKIVNDARRTEVLAQCKKEDSFFICHKHSNVCCRGFFDTQDPTIIQVAKRFELMGLDVIEFVEV